MDPDDRLKLQQHLVGQEESLLLSATRRNSDLVASLLTEDFREFGTSGRTYTKSQILAHLPAEPPTTLSADRFELTWINDDAALLTYDSLKQTEGESITAHRSSLWVRQGETWRILFHQGTKFDR